MAELKRIVVLPIGQIASDVLQAIQHGLKAVFQETEVSIHETVMSMPPEAYNSSRQQYYSTYILGKVCRNVRGVEDERVLGITEADLYATNLNFVFGEAQFSGKAAIISLFRLRPHFYGKSPNGKLLLERTLKEAIHEIGHTLGLRHCQNPSCIMFFSNSIKDTDRKRARFCQKCSLSVRKFLDSNS